MSKTDKPVIVVTGPDKFFPFGWWATRFILHKVGAVAHYVTPKKPTLPLVVHESLKATAYDEDGFVQAIEDPKKAYFVGVQWHPEYMPYRLEQRKLFKALVNSAKKAKSFLDTSALTRE